MRGLHTFKETSGKGSRRNGGKGGQDIMLGEEELSERLSLPEIWEQADLINNLREKKCFDKCSESHHLEEFHCFCSINNVQHALKKKKEILLRICTS